MRLSEKRFEEGRCKRIYNPAVPPFDRLCRTQILSTEKQAQLHALRAATNPVLLRKNIQALIDKISALPAAAAAGSAEDVRLTLFPQEADTSQ